MTLRSIEWMVRSGDQMMWRQSALGFPGRGPKTIWGLHLYHRSMGKIKGEPETYGVLWGLVLAPARRKRRPRPGRKVA